VLRSMTPLKVELSRCVTGLCHEWVTPRQPAVVRIP
jgi:hypothetical protein